MARSANRFCRVPGYGNAVSIGCRLVRTIQPAPASAVAVLSPAGGESWWVGTVRPIFWTATDDINYVTIEYSTNNGTSWTPIAASTPNIGQYNWAVPNTPSSSCLIRVSQAANPSTYGICAWCFSIVPVPAPVIDTNRVEANFCAASGQPSIPSQWVVIGNSGGGTLGWSASASAGWVTVSPSSGTGNGTIKIDANPSGLSPGTYNATVTISDPQASNSPQIVYISLDISSSTEEPYFSVEIYKHQFATYNNQLRSFPSTTVFIDFDSDGDKDIVFGETVGGVGKSEPWGNGRFYAYRNDGNGNFAEATAEVFGGHNVAIAGTPQLVADLNGDGRADLFLADAPYDHFPYEGGGYSIFIQTADGRLVEETAARLPDINSWLFGMGVTVTAISTFMPVDRAIL